MRREILSIYSAVIMPTGTSSRRWTRSAHPSRVSADRRPDRARFGSFDASRFPDARYPEPPMTVIAVGSGRTGTVAAVPAASRPRLRDRTMRSEVGDLKGGGRVCAISANSIRPLPFPTNGRLRGRQGKEEGRALARDRLDGTA